MIFNCTVIGYEHYEKNGKQFTIVHALNGVYNSVRGLWTRCKLYKIRCVGFVDFEPNASIEVQEREYTFADGNKTTYYAIV